MTSFRLHQAVAIGPGCPSIDPSGHSVSWTTYDAARKSCLVPTPPILSSRNGGNATAMRCVHAPFPPFPVSPTPHATSGAVAVAGAAAWPGCCVSGMVVMYPSPRTLVRAGAASAITRRTGPKAPAGRSSGPVRPQPSHSAAVELRPAGSASRSVLAVRCKDTPRPGGTSREPAGSPFARHRAKVRHWAQLLACMVTSSPGSIEADASNPVDPLALSSQLAQGSRPDLHDARSAPSRALAART